MNLPVVQIALAILLRVESSGNPTPKDGDHGIAVGPLQWHQVQVDDYNQRFNDHLTLEQMRDPNVAIPAARKWLTWAAEHYKITTIPRLCADIADAALMDVSQTNERVNHYEEAS